jgi:hypothetical protein
MILALDKIHSALNFTGVCMLVKSSLADDGVCFVLDQHAEFEVYIVLAH